MGLLSSDISQKIFSVKTKKRNLKTYKEIKFCGIKCRLKIKKTTPSFNYCTLHYLLAMLKEYGLKYAVCSPGTQNSNFNYMLQKEGGIKTFSVIDERSAAYIAHGIYNETREPVVLTCTGSSASRNYFSAMTEAFYRKVPLIAITFFDYQSTKFSFMPQFVDRSLAPTDSKYVSIELPRVFDEKDKVRCLTYLNVALSTAFYKHLPVHINCPSFFDFDMRKIKNLPRDIWKNEYYCENFEHLKKDLFAKTATVFIGSHRRFTKEEQDALSDFATAYNIPVLCDHMAHYNGKNKIMFAQIFGMLKPGSWPDIVIDIGDVTGEYYALSLFPYSEIWRVSENSEFTYRFNFPVAKFFDCKEKYFFQSLIQSAVPSKGYYKTIKARIDALKTPDLPLCNSYVIQNLAKYIPNGSSLHHAVSNTKRNMNFWNFDSSVEISCNIGVCGIDGPVSTMVGQSLVAKDKKVFGVVGDLAFFYDMNALGQRDITDNLRIILINNREGVEFRLNPVLENNIGAETDTFIAAQGHNKGGVKGWAESCGFTYMSADSKETFDQNIVSFCQGEFEKPVIFEVFTNNADEQKGLNLIQTFNR